VPLTVVQSLEELSENAPDMAEFVDKCAARDLREVNARRMLTKMESVTPAVIPRGRVVDSATPPRVHVPSDLELACTALGGPCLSGVREQSFNPARGYPICLPLSTSHYSQGIMTLWAGGLVNPSKGIKKICRCMWLPVSMSTVQRIQSLLSLYPQSPVTEILDFMKDYWISFLFFPVIQHAGMRKMVSCLGV